MAAFARLDLSGGGCELFTEWTPRACPGLFPLRPPPDGRLGTSARQISRERAGVPSFLPHRAATCNQGYGLGTHVHPRLAR